MCLIPASAHGTNAASAVMAGMRVVVVATDEDGNVDMDDLRAKAAEHAEDLAAAMVTYPSTHGVFEEGSSSCAWWCTRRAASLRRRRQPERDGRHLPARAVRCGREPPQPAQDVLHPPRWRRPRCRPRRRPSAPGPVPAQPRAVDRCGPGHRSGGRVRRAVRLGEHPADQLDVRHDDGRPAPVRDRRGGPRRELRRARLSPHYPVLYTGRGGLVAHECIVDLRPIERETGISNEDVAKRLIDYGFHAPTMSFPVPGTLMIEPTESEDLTELDRFCDAMIAIREDIRKFADGEWPRTQPAGARTPHGRGGRRGRSDHATALVAGCPRRTSGGRSTGRRSAASTVATATNLMCACPPIGELVELTW